MKPIQFKKKYDDIIDYDIENDFYFYHSEILLIFFKEFSQKIPDN